MDTLFSAFESLRLPEAIGIGTVVHICIFVSVAVHCLSNPRDPRSSIIWLFTVWSFPIIGALLYSAFGLHRVPHKAWQKDRSDRQFGVARSELEAQSQPLAYWRGLREAFVSNTSCAIVFNRTLDRINPDHPLLSGNEIDLLIEGTETYPALLEAIKNAQHHIHIFAYIIGRDAVAREILDACAERAAEGIKVRILYDEFGSATASIMQFFRKYKRVPNMRVVGYTQVNLLKQRIQVNLRNHRKIAVVDGEIAFSGGINIHKGHVAEGDRPAIRDYHFRIKGPLVNELQYTFLRDWYYMTDESPDELLGAGYFGRAKPAGNIAARIVNSGPSSPLHSLDDVLFSALSEAANDVLAVTPYLVLTEPLLHAMRAAALRGVSVRLVVPANNNHTAVHFASRAQYGALLGAGVRIFERTGPLLHAKAMVIDHSLSIFGSANLDVRSLRLNYETNIVSYDDTLAGLLMREMLEDLAQSNEIIPNLWIRRPWRQRFLENLFALASPVL